MNDQTEELFRILKSGQLEYSEVKDVEEALNEGADVHHTDEEGNTALHLAALHGCSYDKVNDPDNTPSPYLNYDYESSYNSDAVELLIGKEADVNAKNTIGNTPLHIAVESGDQHIVKSLLEAGANINATNNLEQTPMHLATKAKYTEIMEFLIQSGANTNAQDSHGHIPIHYAVRDYGSNSSIDLNETIWLLTKGGKSNVNLPDNQGNTTVHLVAEKGNAKALCYLIANNANFNTQNLLQQTPLHLASKSLGTQQQPENLEVLRLILTNGGLNVINTIDNDGNTALHYAAQQGNTEALRYLIDSEANINITNGLGQTPLHLAARRSLKAVQLLAQQFRKQGNTDVINAIDERGFHALHYAIINQNIDTIRYLIRNGATINIVVDEQNIIGRSSPEIDSLLIKHKLLQNHNEDRPNFPQVDQQPNLPFGALFPPLGNIPNFPQAGQQPNLPHEDLFPPLRPINQIRDTLQLWDKCKIEINAIREENLGRINERNVSLYDFLRTNNDVQLIKYLNNTGIRERLENLRVDNFQLFPEYSDLLSAKLEAGERKRNLYNRVRDQQSFINNEGTVIPGLIPEGGEFVNEALGNDHQSRLNLLLAHCPSAQPEQTEDVPERLEQVEIENIAEHNRDR